eukprot:3625902-Prymnesium_polylepis.1
MGMATMGVWERESTDKCFVSRVRVESRVRVQWYVALSREVSVCPRERQSRVPIDGGRSTACVRSIATQSAT